MKNVFLASAIVVALCALLLSGCSGAGGSVGGDSASADNLYSVTASFEQFNGSFDKARVELSYGDDSVRDATVTILGAAVPWSSHDYLNDSSDYHLNRMPGDEVTLSIVRGGTTIAASVVMPSRVQGVSTGGAIDHHPINTGITVTWDSTAAHYAYPPQSVVVSIYFPASYRGESTVVPFSDATFTIVGSLFSTIGTSFYIVVGTQNVAAILGSDVNSASQFTALQGENAYSGYTQ